MAARLFLASVSWLTAVHATGTGSCWRDTQCSGPEDAAFPGEWEENMFAPSSRTVSPVAFLDGTGNEAVDATTTTLQLDSVALPSVIADFGIEVGGILTVQYSVTSCQGENAIGMAFTEAKDFVGPNSDSTTGIFTRPDGALYENISETGDFIYVMPNEYLRGGFRYLTLFLQPGSVSIAIHNISVEIAFQPTWANLRAYQGYFHSNDELLNRIWYSGAYTLQTDAIPPTTGRVWPAPETAWQNTGYLGPGDTILTDGAKRDRTVW